MVTPATLALLCDRGSLTLPRSRLTPQSRCFIFYESSSQPHDLNFSLYYHRCLRSHNILHSVSGSRMPWQESLHGSEFTQH